MVTQTHHGTFLKWWKTNTLDRSRLTLWCVFLQSDLSKGKEDLISTSSENKNENELFWRKYYTLGTLGRFKGLTLLHVGPTNLILQMSSWSWEKFITYSSTHKCVFNSHTWTTKPKATACSEAMGGGGNT